MKWIRFNLQVFIIAVLILNTFLFQMPVSEAATSSDGYYSPSAQPPTSVQSGGTTDNGVIYGGLTWGGLQVGHAGLYKEITDGSLVKIPHLSSQEYHLIETNVTVKWQSNTGTNVNTLQGKALAFVEDQDTSNAGFLFISPSEAPMWVQALNGSPDVLSRLQKRNIIDSSTNQKYEAYDLAELAVECGGKGDPPGGDGLTKIRNDLYFKRDGFIATPRPTASIDPLMATYPLNSQIAITGHGQVYSAYSQLLSLGNFVVRNKTNDSLFTYMDQAGNKGTNKWDKTYTFTASEPGQYEVSLWVEDYYHRQPVQYPVVATFTVGGGTCTPIQSTLKITGQSDQVLTTGGTYKLPKGKNTINSLTFPYTGTLKIGNTTVGTGTTFSNLLIDADRTATFTPTDTTKCEWTFQFFAADPVSTECTDCKGNLNVQTYTASGKGELNAPVSSGGTQFVAYDADYLRIETPVSGKWYDASGNLIPMSSTVKSTSYTVQEFSQSSLTLKFVSDDGTYCWCKTFERNNPGGGSYSCPRIERIGDGTLSSGEVIKDIPLNGKLNLSATFTDPNGDRQSAPLYWSVQKPDGTTIKQAWEQNDKGKWTLRPNSFLNIPVTQSYSPTDQLIAFDKAGTYTISINYDGITGDPYDTWREKNCQWQITVVIVDTSHAVCSDFTYEVEVDGQKATMTGSGTQSSPYVLKVPKGEQNETFFRLLYKGQPGVADGNYSVNGRYVFKGKQLYYAFDPSLVSTPEFTVEVYPVDKPDCITYFKVIWGDPIQFDCSKVYLTTTVNGSRQQLTGDGSVSSPYKMELLLNKDYSIDFNAWFDKNGSGTTDRFDSVTWELTNGKGTTYVGTGNTYSRAFKEAAAGTYTLKLRVKGKGQSAPCPDKQLIIEFRGLTCKDLSIQYKFSSDSAWAKDTGDSITTSPGSQLSKLIDNTGIKIAVTSDTSQPTSANQLKVSWTVINTTTGKALTNDSASPTTLFEKTKIPAGIYTVKAKVTDASNSAFYGCEVYIGFILTSKDSTCDQFYIHVYTFTSKSQTVAQATPYHNVNGKTINADKSTAMYLIAISQSASDIDDGYANGINVDWTVPSPWVDSPLFGDPNEVNWTVWQQDSVPAGTYKITGKLNDKNFTSKCNFEVTIVVGDGADPGQPPTPCDTCNPGGDIDGGKMKINIYDSDNRILVSTADGVWEREPAKVEVKIDQSKLNSAFSKVDGEILNAINDKRAELTQKYPGPDYEKVNVTAAPSTWSSKTNTLTQWPASVPLSITGPGSNRSFSLNPKQDVQNFTYDGTTVPTLTTWNMTLNSGDYLVKADPFSINVQYKVDFKVTYEKCEEIDDPDWVPDPDNPDATAPKIKKCTPGTDSDSINNTYTINVLGDDTSFEVYEPNATGVLDHTTEWKQWHARDRYTNSTQTSFYAGETILTRVTFDPKHRHPFSGKYPTIVSAQSWMYETGGKNTTLKNALNLVNGGGTWKGPSISVAKLGQREEGVDSLPMGDVHRGLQRGTYAVYFYTRFQFGVDKGFSTYDKGNVMGHDQSDYKVPIQILGNANERQSYRTHNK